MLIRGVVYLGVVLLPGMVLGQAMDELIAKLDAISNDCPNAWVNEFHYDNAGIDVDEFVEICFGPDSNPSNRNEYACWIYDQYGGAVSNIGLDEFTLGGSSNGFTFYTYMMPLDDYGIGCGAPTDEGRARRPDRGGLQHHLHNHGHQHGTVCGHGGDGPGHPAVRCAFRLGQCEPRHMHAGWQYPHVLSRHGRRRLLRHRRVVSMLVGLIRSTSPSRVHEDSADYCASSTG